MYNDACLVWSEMTRVFLEQVASQNKQGNSFFWGAHQRFFRYLCISAKVEPVIQITEEALGENNCVVIGLQLTGDSYAQYDKENSMNKYRTESTPSKCVLESILKKFPELRTVKILKLFENVKDRLPKNTLDVLIDRLGGPKKIAEMTGRRRSSNFRDANQIEKYKFMAGIKLIAIVSDAASIGISLQSDRRVQNQRKRVHICLEMPWSADACIQQMGRTHRSNQILPPKYVCPVTPIAGENRFGWGLAKKLEKLGALTQCDRRFQGETLHIECNLQENLANKAIRNLLQTVYHNETLHNFAEILKSVGIICNDTTDENIPWTRFMNRLLGLPIDTQTKVFEEFEKSYKQEISNAVEKSEITLGSNSLVAKSIYVMEKIQYNDASFLHEKQTISLYRVELELGMSWKEVLKLYRNAAQNNIEVHGFYIKKLMSNNMDVALFAYDRERNVEVSYGPGFSGHPQVLNSNKIPQGYGKVNCGLAELKWNHQYRKLFRSCRHKFELNHSRCPTNCMDSRIIQERYILTGLFSFISDSFSDL